MMVPPLTYIIDIRFSWEGSSGEVQLLTLGREHAEYDHAVKLLNFRLLEQDAIQPNAYNDVRTLLRWSSPRTGYGVGICPV